MLIVKPEQSAPFVKLVPPHLYGLPTKLHAYFAISEPVEPLALAELELELLLEPELLELELLELELLELELLELELLELLLELELPELLLAAALSLANAARRSLCAFSALLFLANASFSSLIEIACLKRT